MDLPSSPIPPPFDPLYYILLIVVVAAALWFYLRKKSPCKSTIAIIGERFSGKTQLLISLNEGKKFETVPSIKNNECRRHLKGKEYRMVDYCGDAISKEEVLGELEGIHTVVHVIDGTDSKKIGEAALFIYRLLVSRKYQQHPCNYIIFFNKSDDKAYFGLPRLTKRLEDQIQMIKTSKRNQPEENEAEEDYLKAVKDHFHLPSAFKVIEGSATYDITSLSAILAHQ